MKTLTKSTSRDVFFADKLLLAGFGIHCSLKGMMLPYIMDEFLISYTQSGLLVTASTVGFAISALLSGKLTEKISQVRLLAIYALLMFVSSLMIMFAPSISWIIVAFFLSGICYCGTESMSTAVIRSFSLPGREDKTVSSVFAFYMIGGVLASLICYFILKTGTPWRFTYVIAGTPCLIAGIKILGIPDKPIEKTAKVFSLQIRELFTNRVFVYLCLAAAVFSGVETSTHNWITTFIKDGTSFGAAETYILLALFYLSITVGRIICTGILNKTKTKTKTLVEAVLLFSTLVLLALSYAGNTALVWTLTMAYGLCTSALYPMLISLTSGQAAGRAVYSVTFLAISVGNIATNALLGVIADVFNVKATFRFDGILLGFALAFVVLSEMKAKKQALERV